MDTSPNLFTDLVVSLVFSKLDLRLMQHVRHFVLEFVKAHPIKIDPAQLEFLAVAVHELVENGVRHSIDAVAQMEVRTDFAKGVRILLRTTNRSTRHGADEVASLLERLKGTPANTLYQELLAETSHRSVGSGLGLIRLAAECGISLSHHYVGDVLTIEALSVPLTLAPIETPKK